MLYRWDVQMRYPYADNPSGWYYWRNVWHLEMAEDSEWENYPLDLEQWHRDLHNNNARQDWWHLQNLSTGHVIVNSSINFTANTHLPGLALGLANTVYLKLMNAGKQVGYKRIRVPLRAVDIEGIHIASATYSYLQGVAADIAPGTVPLVTSRGVPIDQVLVSPYVYSWQVRHGTKRCAYRHWH